MPRDIRLYLDDILSALRKIQQYVEGIQDYHEFAANEQLTDAVLFNLFIIGEAIKQIPQSLCNQHPTVPWHEITGLRNIIAHAYFGIDLEIIWNAVHDELSPLLIAVQQMLNEPEDQSHE